MSACSTGRCRVPHLTDRRRGRALRSASWETVPDSPSVRLSDELFPGFDPAIDVGAIEIPRAPDPNHFDLAAERDVDGLVARLQELIDAPGSWESRAAINRARMESEFDAAIQGKTLAAIYARLQNEGRVPFGTPSVDTH